MVFIGDILILARLSAGRSTAVPCAVPCAVLTYIYQVQGQVCQRLLGGIMGAWLRAVTDRTRRRESVRRHPTRAQRVALRKQGNRRVSLTSGGGFGLTEREGGLHQHGCLREGIPASRTAPIASGLHMCAAGSYVWYNHETETWVPAQVSEGGSGDITVELQDTFGENAAQGMVSITTNSAHSPPPLQRRGRTRRPSFVLCSDTLAQEYTHPASDSIFMPMDESNLEPADDMVKLGDLHEAALLHNIRMRFFNDDIFTYIGPILCAANPYKMIPIFSGEFVSVRTWRDYAMSDHINSVVAAPDVEILLPHRDQIIPARVRSCKQRNQRHDTRRYQSVCGYQVRELLRVRLCKTLMLTTSAVASLAPAKRKKRSPCSSWPKWRETMQLLERAQNSFFSKAAQLWKRWVMPRLFATTTRVALVCTYMRFQRGDTIRHTSPRRENTWRFLFDKQNKIMGGRTTKYLLEKVRAIMCNVCYLKLYHVLRNSPQSRIIKPGTGERNYHVFYLLDYLPDDKKKTLKIAKVEDFAFANKGGCTTVEGIDDASDMKDFTEAWTVQGVPDNEVMSVLKIVAGILHLGNVEFEADDEGNSSVTNDEVLEDVGQLFSNDPELLETTLTFRNMQSGGRSIVVIPLKVDQAIETQEGLAKAAYSRTFDAVVERLNEAVKPASPEKNAIGVLDIFGFEIFETKSFEQLCL
eukprot:67795_6